MIEKISKNIGVIISILAIFLLIEHSFEFIGIKIDNTSIILLLIILISPFVKNIKKLKYKDFEAEISDKEVKKIKQDVVDAKLETSRTESDKKYSSILEISKHDIVLALAKLRIEIERKVGRIQEIEIDSTDKKLPLNRIITELKNREIIPSNLYGPLKEVIYLCNRAIHGEKVEEESAKELLEVGVSILDYLNDYVISEYGDIIESEVISKKDVDGFWGSKYKVTTIVPYVEKPIKNIRLLNQSQFDNFLEGYSEYAEFITSIERVPE